MKKVYHLQGEELVEKTYQKDMEILDGDVYAFDQEDIIWIWLGKDSSVDESAASAWLVNKIDQERGGVPEVMTIKQGEEPMLFRENFTLNVIDGDTPGFLKNAKLDEVEYKLFQVFTEKETKALDKASVKEVDLSRDSLSSDDVFVLDRNEMIYVWIGKSSNIEEKRMGQKLIQKIDANRNYLPMQYTIYEGEGGKTEEAFYSLLDKLAELNKSQRTVVSVEDNREKEYRPEQTVTVDKHKEKVDATYETSESSDQPEKVIKAGTPKHRSMIGDEESLPKKGTVASRIAAINEKVDQSERKKDEREKSKVKHTTSTVNTGPLYQGDSIKNSSHKSQSIDDSDCIANDMHQIVWQAGKACTVCGRKE